MSKLGGFMKILENVKKMTLFQKIQIISSIIPFYSTIFVFFTTYIYCSKGKKYFLYFSLISIMILVLTLLVNTLEIIIIKYLLWVIIAFVGNVLYVLIQIKTNNNK